MSINLTAVYHYPVTDLECLGDYYSIDLLQEGVLIYTFGDAYHGSGQDKLEGFIQGMEWISGKKVELKTIDKADIE